MCLNKLKSGQASLAHSLVIHSIFILCLASVCLFSSHFMISVRSETFLYSLTKCCPFLISSLFQIHLTLPYHPLLIFSRIYIGLIAYQVLSWTPPRVNCWTSEEDPIPDSHLDILRDYLLHLFEDKADSNPAFLL